MNALLMDVRNLETSLKRGQS